MASRRELVLTEQWAWRLTWENSFSIRPQLSGQWREAKVTWWTLCFEWRLTEWDMDPGRDCAETVLASWVTSGWRKAKLGTWRWWRWWRQDQLYWEAVSFIWHLMSAYCAAETFCPLTSMPCSCDWSVSGDTQLGSGSGPGESGLWWILAHREEEQQGGKFSFQSSASAAAGETISYQQEKDQHSNV